MNFVSLLGAFSAERIRCAGVSGHLDPSGRLANCRPGFRPRSAICDGTVGVATTQTISGLLGPVGRFRQASLALAFGKFSNLRSDYQVGTPIVSAAYPVS